MLERTDLTQDQIDWLLAHPELNALMDRLIADFNEDWKLLSSSRP